DDGQAQEAAIADILAKAGLTRADYDAKVTSVLEDATFRATRQQSLELCRKASAAAAPEIAPGSAEATREKLKALAVSAECMRKGGVTSDEMASAMLALYKAHEMDLETYTREMAKLGSDRLFQEEVAKAIAEC